MADRLVAPPLPAASEDARARRVSPLASRAEALGTLAPGMRLDQVSFCVMVSLRCAPGSAAATAAQAALGVVLPGANSFATAGQRQVVWLGPDEWLVVGPDGDDALLGELEGALDGEFAAVVDVTGQRTTLDLSGSQARTLLAHGCARDLHPDVAPAGTAWTTVLALAGVTLLVVDASVSEPIFRLLVRSSFATYVVDWMLDASLEYRS